MLKLVIGALIGWGIAVAMGAATDPPNCVGENGPWG